MWPEPVLHWLSCNVSPVSSERSSSKGVKVMKYLQFASKAGDNECPERLVMVLDVSGSMASDDWKPSRLDGAIGAAEALLDVKAKQHPNDQVGIATFSSSADTVYPLAQLSREVHSLKRALRGLEPGSTTNITAGLQEAEKNLFGVQARPSRGAGVFDPGEWIAKIMGANRQLPQLEIAANETSRIILLTDGEHNHGKGPVPLAERLKAAGVVIDCIGIGGSPSEVDEGCLKRVASLNTDGSPRYCFIGERQMLIKKFEQLANRIKVV